MKFCDCGKERHRKRKYCKDCIARRVWSAGVPSFNKITLLSAANTNRVRRRILIETRGHRCEVCFTSTWANKSVPLDLDHVDGNSENNNEENLRLICLNCHGQTPTYKSKNKGRGRKSRRIRYQEGKTY